MSKLLKSLTCIFNRIKKEEGIRWNIFIATEIIEINQTLLLSTISRDIGAQKLYNVVNIDVPCFLTFKVAKVSYKIFRNHEEISVPSLLQKKIEQFLEHPLFVHLTYERRNSKIKFN